MGCNTATFWLINVVKAGGLNNADFATAAAHSVLLPLTCRSMAAPHMFNHVCVSAVAVALQVARGSTVALPHLSLLEVASLPLLFMVNSMAVQRAVARSVHLAM